MKPYRYICANCGSDDVSLEGFIRWDFENQRYEVIDLCDKGHYCRNCDGECRIEQKFEDRQENNSVTRP